MMTIKSIVETTGSKIREHIFNSILNETKEKEVNKISLVFDIINPTNQRACVLYYSEMIGFVDIWIEENGELKIKYTQLKW